MPTQPSTPATGRPRGLRVKYEAGLLARETFRVADALPTGSRGDVADQMRRAATSIFANIAEGEGRRTTADRLRFFTFAWGSLLELEAHADLASYIGALPDADLQLFRQRARQVGRLLWALRKRLTPRTKSTSE